MGIDEQLSRSMREALKGRCKDRLRVLRMLRTELQVAAASGRELSEEDVVRSFATKLRKVAEEYERLGLTERSEQARADQRTVEEFLPQQMSRAEIPNARPARSMPSAMPATIDG